MGSVGQGQGGLEEEEGALRIAGAGAGAGTDSGARTASSSFVTTSSFVRWCGGSSSS